MSSASETTRPLAFAACVALSLLLGASLASAQAGDEATRARARAIAGRATAEYNLSHFQQALELYEQAYAVFAAPQLLFNIGQCQRELGNHERAIFFYDRYLNEMPNAPNAGTVRELLAESRATYEREQAAQRARDEEERRLREAEQQRHLAEAERLEAERREADQRAALLAAQTDAVRGPDLWEEWWFWTLIVGVAVGAGVGISLGVAFGGQSELPMGSLGVVDTR